MKRNVKFKKITMYDISSIDLDTLNYLLFKYFRSSTGYPYLKKDIDKVICYKIRKYVEGGFYD